jgi:hypothetical protein
MSAQDQAIQAYCRSEAQRTHPAVLKVQRVQRMVLVGEKTTGYKTKCETTESEQKSQNQGTSKTTVHSTETKCTNEPIKECIYDYRWVDEQYDENQRFRDDSYRVCFAQATSNGMFKELNK